MCNVQNPTLHTFFSLSCLLAIVECHVSTRPRLSTLGLKCQTFITRCSTVRQADTSYSLIPAKIAEERSLKAWALCIWLGNIQIIITQKQCNVLHIWGIWVLLKIVFFKLSFSNVERRAFTVGGAGIMLHLLWLKIYFAYIKGESPKAPKGTILFCFMICFKFFSDVCGFHPIHLRRRATVEKLVKLMYHCIT